MNSVRLVHNEIFCPNDVVCWRDGLPNLHQLQKIHGQGPFLVSGITTTHERPVSNPVSDSSFACNCGAHENPLFEAHATTCSFLKGCRQNGHRQKIYIWGTDLQKRSHPSFPISFSGMWFTHVAENQAEKARSVFPPIKQYGMGFMTWVFITVEWNGYRDNITEITEQTTRQMFGD